ALDQREDQRRRFQGDVHHQRQTAQDVRFRQERPQRSHSTAGAGEGSAAGRQEGQVTLGPRWLAATRSLRSGARLGTPARRKLSSARPPRRVFHWPGQTGYVTFIPIAQVKSRRSIACVLHFVSCWSLPDSQAPRVTSTRAFSIASTRDLKARA